MWCVCIVLDAVLYVLVSCFVVHGCTVSKRYINICNCDVFSVISNLIHARPSANQYLPEDQDR